MDLHAQHGMSRLHYRDLRGNQGSSLLCSHSQYLTLSRRHSKKRSWRCLSSLAPVGRCERPTKCDGPSTSTATAPHDSESRAHRCCTRTLLFRIRISPRGRFILIIRPYLVPGVRGTVRADIRISPRGRYRLLNPRGFLSQLERSDGLATRPG